MTYSWFPLQDNNQRPVFSLTNQNPAIFVEWHEEQRYLEALQMIFESVDRSQNPEPVETSSEFEKLEFLPERGLEEDQDEDEQRSISFVPEDEQSPEPPVSFSPDETVSDAGLGFQPAPTPEIGAATPFELLETSLFDDFAEDLDDLDVEDIDDLEF